jgi:nitroreductase
MLALSGEELLTTTRAVRLRLDFERPVERALLEHCAILAMQAPSASNRQNFHFVFVDDPELKTQIAERYREGIARFSTAGRAPEYAADDVRGVGMERFRRSVQYLTDNMHRVPVMVIPCLRGRVPEGAPPVVQATMWGTLLPAAWSFMLAARLYSLGTSFTTVHLQYEEEIAGLLGIDHAKTMQGPLIPVAHTIGDDFGAGPRIDSGSLLHWNRW